MSNPLDDLVSYIANAPGSYTEPAPGTQEGVAANISLDDLIDPGINNDLMMNDPSQSSAPGVESVLDFTVPPQKFVDLSGDVAALEAEEQKKNRGNATPKMQAAADRVNANTDNYGVKAVFDADGKLTLTNIGVTPKTPIYPTANGGQGPGQGSIAPNTPLSVGSLYNKLVGTTDVDTARGIAASLREAAAVEQSKYEVQATQFAQNKLGIPALERQLNQAILADQQDPLYRPGMGDSPITARIRTTLEDARNKADTEAKRYLAQNASYAVLGATLKNADNEIARITKIGDREEQIKTTSQLRKQERLELREEQLTEAARGLDGTQRQRLLMLNPALSTVSADKLDADMMRTIAANKGNKQWSQAFQAPEEALPALALAGNSYAESLVVSKEQANTATDPAITRARLADMRQRTTKMDYKQALVELYGSDKEGQKKVNEMLLSFNEKGLDKDSKEKQALLKSQLSFALERQRTTAMFAGDVGAWKIADPKFQSAVNESRKTTGNTNMMNVYSAYIGSSVGPEKVQKTQLFIDMMAQESAKYQGSVFGMPNYKSLGAQIQREANKGLMMEWATKAASALTPKGNDNGQPFEKPWITPAMLPAPLSGIFAAGMGMGNRPQQQYQIGQDTTKTGPQ